MKGDLGPKTWRIFPFVLWIISLSSAPNRKEVEEFTDPKREIYQTPKSDQQKSYRRDDAQSIKSRKKRPA